MTDEQLFAEGTKKALEREYDDAIKLFQEFIEKYPNSKYIDDVYYNLGLCYFSQGKFDEAISTFEYLIKTYPDGVIDSIGEFREYGRTAAKAYIALGNTYYLLKDYNKAIEYFSKLRDYPESYSSVLDPETNERRSEHFEAVALHKIWEIYHFILNDQDKAKKIYDELMSKYPNSLSAREVKSKAA